MNRPPNLLLVFADQMRGQDFGAAGNPQVHTPHLDRLASEGVLCTNAIANCPVCTPSRGSLLTGLNPLAHGAIANDVPIRTDVPSLGSVLRQAGYRTGYIGKWHLDGVPRDRFTPPGPRRLGFDDYWAAWNCHHRYFDGKYYLDSDEPHKLDGYEPDGQTELAIQFINRHRDEPFALVLSWGPPHDPYDQVPETFLSMYHADRMRLRPNVRFARGETEASRRRVVAQYYAAISALDTCLGRLMAALEALGLSERTLVVFTSDHGDMLGSQGMRNKEQPWEESILVPLVLRCPRLLPAGVRCDALIGIMDLMPTMLDLLGKDPPAGLDGRSLAPLLRGEPGATPASVPIGIHVPVDQAVAAGLAEWRGVRTARHTYARLQSGRGWVLYDNREDPFQLHNLVDDMAHAALLEQLERELSGWLERLDDPFLPWDQMVREAGRVEHWNARERYMHPDAPRTIP